MEQKDDTLVIQKLNDEFRRTGRGGRVMMTSGIERLGPATVKSIVDAIRAFDTFDEGNDPHGEHDFGALDVNGNRIFWKIDYYGSDLKAHSPNPADPAVTIRMLTIMLADEY